jgi:hypothetical protein
VTTEEQQPEAEKIRVDGSIDNGRVKIKASRGSAQIVVRFDLSEPSDEHGFGDSDYLISALPDALEAGVAALIDGLEEQRNGS